MTPIRALPKIVVEADEAPLPAEALRALGEVRVQQRLSQPSLCELVFREPPGPLTAATMLPPGAALRVTVRGHDEPLFAGEVTAIEHVYGPANAREVRVRGYDLLHRLRKRQSVRAHVQVSPADLARELVDELGLSVESVTPGPVWPRLFQHRQTDLEMLVDAAERVGLFLVLRGNTLHLITLEGRGDPLPLSLGASLIEARLEVNSDSVCRSVTATGWDPARAETHSGRATRARQGYDVVAAPDLARLGASGVRALVDEPAVNDAHAEGLAQAELDLRAGREVTFWGVAEGDPRLRPGTPVQVTGVAPAVAGRFALTAVTHTVDERLGFLSELSSIPPPPRARPRATLAVPGVVTRVDDPDSLGRVKATLPTFGDVESEWMEVVSVGAGPEKGLIALPDAGDQVLVLLLHEDPGRGVVLGGLYGTAGPPDSGVEGGTVHRYTLVTRGGQRIRLDDEHGVLGLENRAGSYVELSPDHVRLHAAAGLTIEAPGQPVVIRGQSIDFQRA